ncbi:MAG: hypothetical protein Kow0099_00210 [Candidatus Abyssubacteria bacterium]
MDINILKDMAPWEWPEDTAEVLLAVLRQKETNESDRLLAVELAGDFTVINDELAEELLSILCDTDNSDQLRGRAAISFGAALDYAYTDEFEDPESVPISEPIFHRIQKTLHKVYSDSRTPKEVRRRVLEASVRAPEGWHDEAVRAAYSSGDDDWQVTAVFCMRFIGGFDEQILEALNSSNPDVHCEAVMAAGACEVDEAWAHVEALVTSEDTEKYLRLAAIEAAAYIRPEEAGPILVSLTTSDDEDIVEAAYDAMSILERSLEDEFDEFDEDDENGISFN